MSTAKSRQPTSEGLPTTGNGTTVTKNDDEVTVSQSDHGDSKIPFGMPTREEHHRDSVRGSIEAEADAILDAAYRTGMEMMHLREEPYAIVQALTPPVAEAERVRAMAQRFNSGRRVLEFK